MKKILLIASTLLIIGTPAKAQDIASSNTVVTSLSASAGGASTSGTSFSLPGNPSSMITWTTTYSSAPASVTILLQGSLDNSTFYTLDTSTNVSGEIRNFVTAAKFFRCFISAKSGGGTTTCSAVTKSAIGHSVSGPFFFSDGSAANPSISFTSDSDTGLYWPGSGGLDFSSNGAGTIRFTNSQLAFLGFSPAPVFLAEAASTLAMRNSTNAQVLRIYGTYTDASNYDRLSIADSTSSTTIIGQHAGTGLARSLQFGVSNGAQWQISTSGHFGAVTDNTNDIGASAANRPRNIYTGGSIFVGATGGIFGGTTGAITNTSDGVWQVQNNANTVASIVNGTLTTSTASVCTAANTTETDLWTYTLPAGALNADGRGIRITVSMLSGATANVKTYRLYFNGVTLITRSVADNALSSEWSSKIIRTGAATQYNFSHYLIGGASPVLNTSSPTATMSGAIIIKMTGQNSVATANDICFSAAIVETIK